MAFLDYALLVPAGLKALSNFGKAMENKKADDGKVSFLNRFIPECPFDEGQNILLGSCFWKPALSFRRIHIHEARLSD